MDHKGFFILESLLTITLGVTLLLSCARIYNACIDTLQKKLILEEAMVTVDLYLAKRQYNPRFKVEEKEQQTVIKELTLREVQVIHEDKVVFTITVAK